MGGSLPDGPLQEMSGWSPLTAKGKNSVTDLSDGDEVGAGTHFLALFWEVLELR